MSFLNNKPIISQNLIALTYKGKSFTYSEIDLLISNLYSNLICINNIDRNQIISFSLSNKLDEYLTTLALMKNNLVGLNLSHDKTFLQKQDIILNHQLKYLIIENDQIINYSATTLHFQILNQYNNLSLIEIKNSNPKSILPGTTWSLITSGTTGESKIVLIDEENLKQRTLQEIQDFNIDSTDRILCFLNFSHDLGLNQVTSSYYANAHLVLYKYIFIDDFVQTIKNMHISGITSVAKTWRDLIVSGLNLNDNSTFLRYITISGSSLTPTEENQLRNIIPKQTLLIKTYGQTETFRSLISKNIYEKNLGLPVSGVQLKLKNVDDNCGELIHSGNGTMLGYLGENIKCTQINTGDLFRIDQNGNFEYLGRHDDMIKQNGLRFYPQEMENHILKFFNLSELALIQIKTRNEIESLVLFYKTIDNISISEQEFKENLQNHFEKSIIPTYFFSIDKFPYLHSGKIDKTSLKNQASSLLLNKYKE